MREKAIYVGTRKGLFTVHHDQGRWRIVASAFVGQPVNLVAWDARDAALYAVLDLGHYGTKLHRSADRGATWTEITSPSFPEKPAERVDVDGAGREVPWTVKGIWALTPGGASQPGRLWCGTLPGGLFVSDDAGESWSLNLPLWDHQARQRWFGGGADWPSIHSIVIDPRRPERVALAVSCGGVWVSDDDGSSWNLRCEGMRATYMPPDRADDPAIQDPHCMVQCLAEPTTWWVQHHNGIFVSRDDCASWQSIEGVSPSNFGFAVAVHPQRGDTAWFVPATADDQRYPVDGKVVVNRTRDGGASFETLRAGLPQEHAFDLVYRHALDVDGEGKSLAFGSTTGSLWVSDDEGDHWDTVATHLPPIYCVRIAEG